MSLQLLTFVIGLQETRLKNCLAVCGRWDAENA